MFAQTLAREGWLLIVSENTTFPREAGYVKGRLYELLSLHAALDGLGSGIHTQI